MALGDWMRTTDTDGLKRGVMRGLMRVSEGVNGFKGRSYERVNEGQ